MKLNNGFSDGKHSKNVFKCDQRAFFYGNSFSETNSLKYSQLHIVNIYGKGVGKFCS